MAIAIDNSAIASGNGVSTPYTCSGSDRVLVVMTFNTSSASTDPSVCTYNGVALTKLGGVILNSILRATLWYLVAPLTGANTLAVSSGTDHYFVSIISLTGSSGVVQNLNANYIFSGTCDASISSGASDMIVAGNVWVTTFGPNPITGDFGLTIDTNAGSNNQQAVGHIQFSTTSIGFSKSGDNNGYMIGASVVAGSQTTTSSSTSSSTSTTTTSSSTSSTTSSSTSTSTTTTSSSTTHTTSSSTTTTSSSTTHSTSTSTTTTSSSTSSSSSVTGTTTSTSTSQTTSTSTTTTSSSTTSSSSTSTITTSTSTTITAFNGLTFAKKTENIISSKGH